MTMQSIQREQRLLLSSERERACNRSIDRLREKKTTRIDTCRSVERRDKEERKIPPQGRGCNQLGLRTCMHPGSAGRGRSRQQQNICLKDFLRKPIACQAPLPFDTVDKVVRNIWTSRVFRCLRHHSYHIILIYCPDFGSKNRRKVPCRDRITAVRGTTSMSDSDSCLLDRCLEYESLYYSTVAQLYADY
jgi:hypothetical protein